MAHWATRYTGKTINTDIFLHVDLEHHLEQKDQSPKLSSTMHDPFVMKTVYMMNYL